MKHQSLYTSWLRYKTLRTHIITALPIVILMPHSACNCRCVMCDIWKGNRNLKQLTEADVQDLMFSLKKLRTVQVLFTGGEAILHPNFFTLCSMLKKLPVKITLITSGHAIKQHAAMIASHVDDMIISLDGSEAVHNAIRNVPNAFAKTKENVQMIKSIKPGYTIGARTVIHKLNFRVWPQIIDAAKEMGLDGISFFPADTTSPAFNHTGNEEALQDELHIDSILLPELHAVIEALIVYYKDDFASGYIAESPDKIRKIYAYYAAFAGLNDFPYKKCNAPWVAAVIEPDGSVKPCFFHDSIGNIREASLDQVINGEKAIQFRKMLETTENTTCTRCVSPLHLGPTFNPAAY